MMVSLDALLRSRDERSARQKELLAAFPGCSLVCLTVIVPGEVKRTRESLIVAGAGVAELTGRFAGGLKHAEFRDLETGYEAYFVLPQKASEVKAVCCSIEENHPLGRLMDIDVLGTDALPLERSAIGLPPRKCLICGREARVCMRLGAHGRAELEAKIKQMINAYV